VGKEEHVIGKVRGVQGRRKKKKQLFKSINSFNAICPTLLFKKKKHTPTT